MKHDRSTPLEVLAETSHLRLINYDGWSYVERTSANGVVCIVARTPADCLLLVEQYRPPVNRRVIELPAGLSGDLADQPDEHLETAARRELLEETGYEASPWNRFGDVASSAGLTNEVVTMFIANHLVKVAAGGGDASEDITVHEIPLTKIDTWLQDAQRSGKLVDARVYSGLYLLGCGGPVISDS